MVLDKQRSNFDPAISIVAKRFSRLHPNTISWASVLFAFVAGLFFYFSSPENELRTYFLFGASFFVFLNGMFDAIDGKVAKITNKSSKRGDFLDHALDRYADVFMVGGLGLSGWVDLRIGFIAIIGMLLTSYMGTQSQAIGQKRDYSGLLGRADRLVLLMIAPIIQHLFLYYNHTKVFGFSILELVLIYFAVMGNITALQRFFSTLRNLQKKEQLN